MRVFGPLLLAACAVVSRVPADAQEPPPPRIEDLYLTDAVNDPITLADGRTAVYVRSWVDAVTRTTRQSLWRVDDDGPPRPLEPGEPDAFGPRLSPDGRWILFHSTRPFPDGQPAFEPVPPYSDPAADLWLIPVDGGRAIPLGGPEKPYGRVITDRFYGRVSFSPDGTRLAFVADEGIDPRTEAERANAVIVVRDDQGEGYEGYGPTQVWVADLLAAPTDRAAARIRRVTDGRFWYGDPHWAPDGSFIVVHANRTDDQESVRYSINRNFDLWRIWLDDLRIEQLTDGRGPEFSPRISADGRRLVCLSSPRRGPHFDVFNLLVVDLGPERGARVLYDHHASDALPPPSLSPSIPLPDGCWRDARHVVYSAVDGLRTVTQCVDVDGGPRAVDDPAPAPARRSPLLPAGNPAIGPRLRAEDEIVRWTSSDGLEIEGVVTLPPPGIAQPPYKLLLLPHGGPHSRTGGGGGFDVQIFAMHGYAVFQPNFRGSTGYGRRFLDAGRLDLGGGDMQDIVTGIEMLEQRGLVDRERQFVYGVSYGGYLTTWLVSHTDRFRAAVAQNAVTDLDVMWHLSDLQSWTEWEMGGLPWEVADRMRAHSPLAHVERVRTPTLILHSLNDRRCPVAMGRMFHRALRTRGVRTEMVIYPDEGHAIKQLPHREDVLRRTLDWFEEHDVPRDDGAKASCPGAAAGVSVEPDGPATTRPDAPHDRPAGDVIRLTAKETLTGVEMNHGDRVQFTLRCGRIVTLELGDTGAAVVERIEPGGIVYRFWCDVRVDGQPITLQRYVGSQESFYEPYVISGLRIWPDTAKAVFDLIPVRYPEPGHRRCVPRKAARFAIQDATLRICPETMRPWLDEPQDFIDVARCYNGDDCYLGAYLGQACHIGLDINHPKGSPLSTPIRLDTHAFFDTLAAGDDNNRWRGIRRWDNGEIWALQTHHLTELLVPPNAPVAGGTRYATSAGVSVGSHEHTHFEFKVGRKHPDDPLPGSVDPASIACPIDFDDASPAAQDNPEILHLDPWILFWQIFEDRKRQRGDLQASLAPLPPVRTGEPVRFNAEITGGSGARDALDCLWTFGDGGSAEGGSPAHVYSRPGIYPVTVFVREGTRQASRTHHQVVSGQPSSEPSIALAAPDEPSFQLRPAFAADVYGWPLKTRPHTLKFVARPSRPRPDARHVWVRNAGGGGALGAITVSVDSSLERAEWLQITVDETAEPRLRVAVDASGLEPGSYGASVRVAAQHAVNSPQAFRVALEVPGDPPAEGDVTVDDADSGFFATPYFWVGHRLCRVPADRRGHRGFYLTNGGAAADGPFVRLTPDLQHGRYAVALHDATPFAPDVRFDVRVRHRGGLETIGIRPSRSRRIGAFDFDEGADGYVEILAAGAEGVVSADAVVFQRQPMAP